YLSLFLRAQSPSLRGRLRSLPCFRPDSTCQLPVRKGSVSKCLGLLRALVTVFVNDWATSPSRFLFAGVVVALQQGGGAIIQREMIVRGRPLAIRAAGAAAACAGIAASTPGTAPLKTPESFTVCA